jgi:CheY-like chemotaxis protein
MDERRGNVLLVQGTATRALMIQHMLESGGYGVRHARDANEALKMLIHASDWPNLILCGMPAGAKDSYAFCRSVKADNILRRIPVVLIVDMLDPQQLIEIIECGADNFILSCLQQSYFLSRLNAISALESQALPDNPAEPRRFLMGGLSISRDKALAMLGSAFETAVHLNWRIRESSLEGDDESTQ